jgi:hypothetical protein
MTCSDRSFSWERLLAAVARDSISACEWIGRRGSADV